MIESKVLYPWVQQTYVFDVLTDVIPIAHTAIEADSNVSNNPTILLRLDDYQLDEIPGSDGDMYGLYTTPGDTDSGRLKNFLVPQRWGLGYVITIKDTLNNDITPEDGDWRFDYENGLLTFDLASIPVEYRYTHTLKEYLEVLKYRFPIMCTVYQYIGKILDPSGSDFYEFSDHLFRIYGNDDSSKMMAFEVSGISAASTRVFTVPDYDGTLATLAGTETFTSKTLDGAKVNYIDFDLTALPVHVEGRLHWDDDAGTLELGLPGGNVKLQIGQEIVVRVTNKTGSTLLNGRIIKNSSSQGSRPTVEYASAAAGYNQTGYAMLTEDIVNNASGYATFIGIVRDMDTSSWPEGTAVYLSTVAGELTDIPPAAPDHIAWMGVVLNSHATEGSIYFKPNLPINMSNISDVNGTPPDSINNLLVWDDVNEYWDAGNLNSTYVSRDLVNGTFQESFNALVTSNGTTITLSLEQGGGGDLTMQFSDGNTVLDCTPACTIELTPGTIPSPQKNWVYIDQSTKVLTKSVTGWPSGEYIAVGFFYVQSAIEVQAVGGALINQNWNDHLSSNTLDNMGHITHIASWIRRNGAVWFYGTDGEGSHGYVDLQNGDTEMYIMVGAGIVSQMHLHNYIAKDTSLTDYITIANHPTTAWTRVQDLGTILVDSIGGSLSGKYYNVVIGGVANKGGEYSPLMVKLPSGSYGNSSDAIGDVDSYTSYTMPREFNKESGTGFLLAEVTIKHNIGGGTFEIINERNLKGYTGITAASGGGVGGAETEFSDSSFRVFNNIDPTKKLAIDTSGIATGNTRTLTIPDYDATIATLDGTETLTSKTLTTPTISDFTNAMHDHSNDANGGIVSIPSHTIASHSDTTATGADLNILTGGGNTVLHLHNTETTSRTINWTTADSAADMQADIDAIGKYITNGINITCQFADSAYTMSQELTLEGFYGGGSISILGNSSDNTSSLTKSVVLDFSGQECNGIDIKNCSLGYINVFYIDMKVRTTAIGNSSIYIESCLFVDIEFNVFRGDSVTNGKGVFVNRSSRSRLISNYVSLLSIGIQSSNSKIYSNVNISDASNIPQYGLRANVNGDIGKNSTQPIGTIANEIIVKAGLIR